ncbi:hypothetical protein O181_067039 [Austropuccinia psidii MF-1]|uniref:Uncharacterized protein n=1 Tax=Austropuccinia psidii MF-1 TaxID=1389203 RepID=A0A9Q3EU50_9BASI|nr:hypothetical protein [Austropuccinia psidii MF-1]
MAVNKPPSVQLVQAATIPWWPFGNTNASLTPTVPDDRSTSTSDPSSGATATTNMEPDQILLNLTILHSPSSEKRALLCTTLLQCPKGHQQQHQWRQHCY